MNALLLIAALAASGVSAQPKPDPYDWINRLDVWLTAAWDHTPGRFDNQAQTVGTWSRPLMQTAWLDVNATIKMARCGAHNCRVTVVMPDGRSAPWRSLNRREQERYALVLKRLEALGIDAVIKRGAILHGDIAMLGQYEGESVAPDPASFQPLYLKSPVPQSNASRQQVAPERFVLRFDDGRQQSLDRASIHWEFARSLLDAIAPSPAQDEMVRLWYHGTIKFLQREEMLDNAHIEHARKIFPADPEVLFQLGCLHETYASDGLQNVIRTAVVPRNTTFDVGSDRAELRQAESFFKRAVELRPDFAEAHLRLGRVIGLLGRHADAVRELESVVDASGDALLGYYRRLFLGAERESLGQLDAARSAFEEAAALYPSAQSPYLALSHLAQRRGDRAAALKALAQAFGASAEDVRDDPWWAYHTVQGVDADERLERVYVLFRREDKE